MEQLGATYRIRTTLPAAAHFSNPTPSSTKDLPFDVRGNQPPSKKASPNVFEGDIPVIDATRTVEGFQDYPGESRAPEFDTGRNSNPEQVPTEKGPGTNTPAETSPEIGEETSALGDVAGLAELL